MSEVSSHFKDIDRVILKEITNSTKSIYLAIAWLTDLKIIELLIERAKSNIDIEIILSNDEINLKGFEYFKILQKNGGKIFIYGNEKNFMHNKYAIVDNSIIITGSYNWSNTAKSKAENISVIKDIDIANQYLDNFVELKIKCKSISSNSFLTSNHTNIQIEPYYDPIEKWYLSLSEEWKEILFLNVELQHVSKQDSFLSAKTMYHRTYGKPFIFKKFSISDLNVNDLAKIKYLNLNDTKLSDYSPLSQLSDLIQLSLSKSEFSDLSLVNSPELLSLFLYKTKIVNFNLLGKFHALTELDISYSISNNNIGILSKLINLEKLTIRNCELTTIDFLEPLKKLKKVDIGENKVENIKAISNLYNLEELWCSSNGVSILDPIRELKSLRFVEFYKNPVSSIEPILNLSNLTVLSLSGSKIQNINGISALSKLEKLFISETSVIDICEIGALKNLKTLFLSNMNVTKLPSPNFWNTLEEILIDNTHISDLSPLNKIQTLKKLNCEGSRVSNKVKRNWELNNVICDFTDPRKELKDWFGRYFVQVVFLTLGGILFILSIIFQLQGLNFIAMLLVIIGCLTINRLIAMIVTLLLIFAHFALFL